ncbi:MAG: Asp-tRNA(Asn)/Glu-tRNA(Gln) amidotransferase GatCAB subunit A, partial [Burkholderiaceae bacterium]|nr:Asp-tRNA(Asn)/Glu-tRNA(Gln) amidotransferase GatCAB subunit A [Burkholderiaceae bacterium]
MSDNRIAIPELTAAAVSEMVRSGQHKAEELAQAFLDYAKPLDETLQAFAYLNDEAVLLQARILDAGRESGGELGSLAGVPIALKDVVDTFDMPAEYGSPTLA